MVSNGILIHLLTFAVLAATPIVRADEAQAPVFSLAADQLPVEGRWKVEPVLLDVNRDGHTDLAAVARMGDGPHVWLGDSKGGWTDASKGIERSFSCGGGLAFGRIDGDQHLDLVQADHCYGVTVYLNDGEGGWRQTARRLAPRDALELREQDDSINVWGTEHVALGDIDRDGFLDIVTGAWDQGGFAVYLGDGSGVEWKESDADGLPSYSDPGSYRAYGGGTAPRFVLVDMNADQELDIVASFIKGPRLFYGGEGATWRESETWPVDREQGGNYWGLAVDDIDGDGKLDLAMANVKTGIEVYLQREGGTFEDRTPASAVAPGGAWSVELVDLNGDQTLDLVVGGVAVEGDGFGAHLYYGDGGESWQEVKATGLPTLGLRYVWGIAVGDVDLDGRPDLALATGGGGPFLRKVEGQVELELVSSESESLPRLQVWLSGGGTHKASPQVAADGPQPDASGSRFQIVDGIVP